MQRSGGDGDMSVLLTLKEAEASSLKQQVSQLAEELRRNVEVSCLVKDNNVIKYCPRTRAAPCL